MGTKGTITSTHGGSAGTAPAKSRSIVRGGIRRAAFLTPSFTLRQRGTCIQRSAASPLLYVGAGLVPLSGAYPEMRFRLLLSEMGALHR